MDDRFLRIQMLLGSPAMERLAEVHVCVLGLGGVGSWCAEALARSGVGALTLMDQDTVDRSNLNRQAEALESTLGMPKAEAMAARVLDVNPHCRVRPIRGRYESASREAFFSVRYDYVVDAIDLVSCKPETSPSSPPWGPEISWTPPFCGCPTSPRPRAAPWPG